MSQRRQPREGGLVWALSARAEGRAADLDPGHARLMGLWWHGVARLLDALHARFDDANYTVVLNLSIRPSHAPHGFGFLQDAAVEAVAGPGAIVFAPYVEAPARTPAAVFGVPAQAARHTEWYASAEILISRSPAVPPHYHPRRAVLTATLWLDDGRASLTVAPPRPPSAEGPPPTHDVLLDADAAALAGADLPRIVAAAAARV